MEIPMFPDAWRAAERAGQFHTKQPELSHKKKNASGGQQGADAPAGRFIPALPSTVVPLNPVA
jgi:hypothetical protein